MRILITGSTGFIGKNLLMYLLKHDVQIVSFSRSNNTEYSNIVTYPWEFGQSLPKIDYSKFDYAIHLAHDFNGIKGAIISIRSNVSIIKYLYKEGINNQLFVSSYSAGPFAESYYGKSKYIIEKNINKLTGVTIVRPGLVIGDGGIYKRLKFISNILPILPLPDGGVSKVPTIKIGTLCSTIYLYLKSNKYLSELNIFDNYTKLSDILKDNNKLLPVIIHIPSKIYLLIFKVLEILNMSFLINLDNVKGYISNINANHKSNIDHISC